VGVTAPPADRVAPAATRRRQLVIAGTCVFGAVVLGIGVARPADSAAFYAATVLVAAIWIAGALLADRLDGTPPRALVLGRRALVPPLLVAVAAYAFFALASLAVRLIPPVHTALADILGHARHGTLVLVVLVALLNGVAEEAFFRGAVFATLPARFAVLGTTLVYAVVTAGTGNVALVLAAVVMGYLFARQRLVAGGILAPMLTHLVWSMLVVFLLPR
jgi:membrane protease YdiL (CAAX protease family)